MRRVRRIAGILVQVVAVTAALTAAAVFLLPRAFGWRVVTVMSGSMSPAYKVDAVLAIRPVSATEIHTGDVIAFEAEDDRPWTTHRVIDITNDAGGLSFITKGDANEDPDADPVPASELRGRVAFGVPALGLFVRAVDSPTGFTLFILFPGALLIAGDILTMRREKSSDTPATWQPPVAADRVSGPEDFDFWTTVATEERYYEALGHEVRQ